jgi:hypothetical protein
MTNSTVLVSASAVLSTWAQDDYVITLTCEGVAVSLIRHSPEGEEGTHWNYATPSLAHREIDHREAMLERVGWARVAGGHIHQNNVQYVALEVDTRW